MPPTPAETLQEVSSQLGKIQTLVGIQQYDSARLQLRQGPSSGLRLQLRNLQANTWPANTQKSAQIIQDLEKLDGSLKGHCSQQECKDLVKRLKDDIDDILQTAS